MPRKQMHPNASNRVCILQTLILTSAYLQNDAAIRIGKGFRQLTCADVSLRAQAAVDIVKENNHRNLKRAIGIRNQ